MRFRNNRIPYMFPAWIDGRFEQITVVTLVELTGTVVEEYPDRYQILVDPDCLTEEARSMRIEWLKECMEVIEP